MIGDVKNRLARPKRLRLSEREPVGPELIEYCLKHARRMAARYRTLDNYYHNDTAVQRRILPDPDKPNNRISHGMAKYITKIATAYFMGQGIRYETGDAGYKKALDEILEANATKIRHFEEAVEMSRQGVAYELLYIDRTGNLRTQSFSANEMIPVFGDGIGQFLFMALRPYTYTSLQNRVFTEYVDVYTRETVETWRRAAGGAWNKTDCRSHGFSDVPVIIRMNNAEMKGDYEDILPQIDAYDKAQSDTLNDLDYFTDAYLVLEGVDELVTENDKGEEVTGHQAARALKQDRMINMPENGKAYFITKESNDTTAENYKNRIYRDIFTLALVPNLTDEEFAGNLSGVAIKYKLFGLEELSAEKETYFTSSEMKKIRFITEYINILRGTSFDWREVKLKFDRSAVANTLEIAQIMNMLRDILSDETLIGLFPEIEDAAEELKKRGQEQDARENRELPDDGAFS